MSLNDYDINRERRLVINLITSKEFDQVHKCV